MTTLFFLFSLTIGWSSYNLFRPVYRLPGIAVLSFVWGWLTGELALHHIVWQVALVALFAWGGAIEGLAGALGLAICVAAWLAMGYFYLTGEKAKEAVNEALQAGLGANYAKVIPDEIRNQFPTQLDQHRLRHPFAGFDRDVEVIKNIAYGSHRQRLDIYRSRQRATNCPVLLQIHGGAWTEKMGSKEHQALPLMTHMAKRNWISVSVDYRLCPRATFPEHIIDCKEGLKWIKENIQSYGGNPDFIVVTGGSAGGHLSALLALSANDPAFQPGFPGLDTTVQGAVPFYGVYDLTDSHGLQHHTAQKKLYETSLMKLRRSQHLDAYKQASPLHRVHANAPPFFIIHGDKDTLVPVEEARLFAQKLREVSKSPVAYAEIEGAQHAFDMFASIRSEHTKHGVEKFLAYLYANHLATTGRELAKS